MIKFEESKKSLYILIALILLILCIGAFLFLKNGSFNKTSSKEENNTNQYTAEKASTSESEKMETQTILKAIPTHRTQAILTHQQTQLILKNNLVCLNTQKLKLQHFQQNLYKR